MPLVGKPAQLSVRVYGFSDTSWRERAVAEVKGAARVALVTYQYDHPKFHAALLARLSPRNGAFDCTVVVDREAYTENRCANERGSLQALKAAGANVFLASGCFGEGRYRKHCGSCHIKALALDGRVLYAGSANFTEASEKNKELVFRFTGHPVRDTLASLDELLSDANTQRL